MRSMNTFDPTKSCKVHDQLNDCSVDWKPEWADDYSKHATSSFGESIVAWDGLILDGWAHNKPALVE